MGLGDDMNEYALLINGTFSEIRRYDSKPPNQPQKGATWHDVLREYGEPFTGLEGDVWVIRTVDPSTLPPPVPEYIFRRQAATQLRNNQFITQAEALAMASTATIPPFVQSYFNTLDPTDKADAELEFTAIEYPRSSSLLTAVMEANGLTSAQIDQFFIAAAQL